MTRLREKFHQLEKELRLLSFTPRSKNTSYNERKVDYMDGIIIVIILLGIFGTVALVFGGLLKLILEIVRGIFKIFIK